MIAGRLILHKMDDVIAKASEDPWMAAGCCLALAGLAFLWNFQGKKLIMKLKCQHIPGPPGQVPFLGHALVLLRGNVWQTFSKWADTYGSLYRVTVLDQIYICVSEPELIKQVMQKKMDKYIKDGHNYAKFACLLGQGIVTAEGERWHGLRKQIAPTLKLEILEGVGMAAVRVTQRLFEDLDKACETGERVDMSEHFRRITLQVISLSVLGIGPEEADASLASLYLPIIDECNDRIWYPHRSYIPTPAWFEHNRTVAKLNKYLEDKVRSRWAEKFEGGKFNGKPNDILDRILMTEEKMTAQKISELRDGLKTFLFAGHDTTSCMLTWALWELMCSPSDVDLCVKEANETFAKGFEAEFEDIKGAMMHTFNVLRETLRIHSVVPVVTRQLNEDDELGGMRVPKGAIVVVNMRGVHHRADIWPGGDPEKFRPSRFGVAATTSPLTGLNGIDPWAFLPFINGPRNCLGQHFSLLESRVIVAMLMQRYVFTPAKGQTGECHAYKIPITPVDGMWVNIQRRK